MWTAEHRRVAARKGLRYPSDLTDGEWALIEPMIPPAKGGGRRREVNVREVLNAIFYVPIDRLPVAGTAQGFAAEEHVGMLLDVLVPQDLQRDVLALQLSMDRGPIGLVAAAMALLGADRGKELRFQHGVSHLGRQWP